jgi:hypothetical protein
MKQRPSNPAAVGVALLLLGGLTAIALVTRNDLDEPGGSANLPAVTDVELEVHSGLVKNHFHADEGIWLTHRLYNLGDTPLTIWGTADDILHFKVYDDHDQLLLSSLPDPSRPESLVALELEPRERVGFGPSWAEHDFFALSRPGRYRIAAWAEIRLDARVADPLQIHADPVWIEIITGESVAFRPVEWNQQGAVPEEVRRWVQNSLKFHLGHFANAKEYDGRQYLFVISGTGGGFEPSERQVEILDVLAMETELAVRVRFSQPAHGQPILPDELYDVVSVAATGLPVRFVPIAHEWVFVYSLSFIHHLPDIVAHSRSVKLFAPAPGDVVGREFGVSAVASAFEATVHYGLYDADGNALDGGLMTIVRAPGFTRDPVIVDPVLWGPGHWPHFAIDVQVPENVADGAKLFLRVAPACPAGYDKEEIVIPLTLDTE